MGVHTLWNDPPDGAYAPYYEEFKTKWAPNFTSVEDLILCKMQEAVSEDPIVGTDQTVEPFEGSFLKPSFVCLQLKRPMERVISRMVNQ